jgi:hypothetical protein
MDADQAIDKVATRGPDEAIAVRSLHPSWCALIRYCADLKHGEIERLKIQNGLPMLAEVTKQKIKFCSERT